MQECQMCIVKRANLQEPSLGLSIAKILGLALQ